MEVKFATVYQTLYRFRLLEHFKVRPNVAVKELIALSAPYPPLLKVYPKNVYCNTHHTL